MKATAEDTTNQKKATAKDTTNQMKQTLRVSEWFVIKTKNKPQFYNEQTNNHQYKLSVISMASWLDIRCIFISQPCQRIIFQAYPMRKSI